MKTLALAALLCAPAAPALAEDKPKASLSAEFSPRDVLKSAQEGSQRVVLILRNGTQYSAFVKEAGAHAVVLKEPAGKEFFEVYVVLSEIASIELRTR